MNTIDMTKLIIYSVFIILVGISCDKDEVSPRQADKFVKFYGGLSEDHGNDVRQLPEGGYFIIGTIKIGNYSDIFTLVTDEYGNSKAGLKTFDGNHLNDKASRMQLTDDGGAVAIGTFQQALGNNDIWVLRFNSQGDTLWTRRFGKSYGDDEGYHLIINSANEIIAVGYTEILTSGGVYDKQIWMHSISSLNGEDIFTSEKIHGLANLDEVVNCVLEVDNEYILIGSENPKNSSRNILIKKTNSVGNINSSATIPSDNDDQGNMITMLSDGNFLILGTKTDISDNTSDIVLIKINGSFKDNQKLEILDEKILDDGENESASCFIQHNNRIHILGTTAKTDTRKILLIITDESGNNPMYLKYGLKNIIMEGYGMDYTSDGGHVFTGSNLVLYKIKDSGEL